MTIPGVNTAFALVTGLTGSRLDPYLQSNFLVEIEGLLVGGFSEVAGLETEIEVEEIHEGGFGTHQLPKGVSHPRLVLKHGLTDLDLLWGWLNDVAQMRPGLWGQLSAKLPASAKSVMGLAGAPGEASYRRNGSLFLLDSQRLPAAWWNFKNAYPVKWSGPTFNADSGTVAVESLELVHEGLDKPTLSRALSATRLGLKVAGV